jgi:Phage virion morphogenesis family
MFNIDADVTIEAKFFKSFMKELKVSVSNMSPAFKEYGDYVRKETDNQFLKEIDPDGKPWVPLKPATLLRKKTAFKLRETYEMSRSFYVDVDPKSMSYGLKDPKYIFHHYGTRKMAARVVIGDTNERRGKLNKFIVKYLKTKRAGRR